MQRSPETRTIATAEKNSTRRRQLTQLAQLQSGNRVATDVSYLYNGMGTKRLMPRPPDWPVVQPVTCPPLPPPDDPASLARYVSSRAPTDLPTSEIPAEFHTFESSPLPGAIVGTRASAPPIFDPQSASWRQQSFPSNQPTSRAEVIQLARTLETMLQRLGKTFAPGIGTFLPRVEDEIATGITGDLVHQLEKEVQVWDVAFREVTRQVFSQCTERGALLSVIHTNLLALSRALLRISSVMQASQVAAVTEASRVRKQMAELQEKHLQERQALAEKHKNFIAYLVQGGEDAEQSGRLWGFDFNRNSLAIARASAAAVFTDQPPPPAHTATDIGLSPAMLHAVEAISVLNGEDITSVGSGTLHNSELTRSLTQPRQLSESATVPPSPSRLRRTQATPEARGRLPNQDGLERLFAGIKQRAGLAEPPALTVMCMACGRAPTSVFCCHEFTSFPDKCSICCQPPGSPPCRHILPKQEDAEQKPQSEAKPKEPVPSKQPSPEVPKIADVSPVPEQEEQQEPKVPPIQQPTPPDSAFADLATLAWLQQAVPQTIAELLQKNKSIATKGTARSVKWLNSTLLEMILTNPFEQQETTGDGPALPIAGIYTFFRTKFPVKKMAHEMVMNFFASLQQHCRGHPRIRLFIRWTGLANFVNVIPNPCSKQAYVFYREILLPLRNGLNKAQVKALEEGDFYIQQQEAESLMESALESISFDVQRIAAIKERTRVHVRTSVHEGQMLFDVFMQLMVDAHESLAELTA
eukprot:TRINITY_DN25023_c0_g1_i1.p1 TRINITY_DN25023_c0_g1~~TRINITY_DN25023_c0_g1_i1.p1  ORF type:complete len:754 (+),score=117.21 TRINITY_DN25023_c0_g1_i1:27-2288(+)